MEGSVKITSYTGYPSQSIVRVSLIVKIMGTDIIINDIPIQESELYRLAGEKDKPLWDETEIVELVSLYFGYLSQTVST